MTVVNVALEVIGQILDAGRQDCDLHFGRAGIVRTALKPGYDIRFLLHAQRH